MIYIDPPYNTGGEFVYPDDYADPLETYLQLTGQSDRQGKLLKSNPETSGRFHSAWLSMMYPRLFLARQLLRDDGILFVSIDEHERHNLQLLMNEIFGEENLVADLVWKKKSGGGSDAKEIVVDHEYILAYARSRPAALFPDRGATAATRYNRTDEEGRRYSLDRLDKPSLGYQESLDFPIEGPDGRTYRVPHADPRRKVTRWRWSRKRVEERYATSWSSAGPTCTRATTRRRARGRAACWWTGASGARARARRTSPPSSGPRSWNGPSRCG